MCESVNSESPRWWNNHVLSQVSFCRMKASERCKVTHAELTPWFNLSLNVYSLLCRSSSIVKWDRKKPSDSFCQHDWGVSEYWQWISSPTLPRPDAKCHQTRLKWCKSMCVLLCDIYIYTHICVWWHVASRPGIRFELWVHMMKFTLSTIYSCFI